MTSPEYPGTSSIAVASVVDVYTRGQSLKIQLIGENKISGDRCIFVSGALEISGNGSLNATGYTYGVYAGGDLTIDSAAISASTVGGTAVNSQGNLTIRNSNNVTGTSTGTRGIYGLDSITIEGSNVTGISTSSNFYSGIQSNGNITVKDSKLTAKSANDAGLVAPNGSLSIINSTVEAMTEFDDDEYGTFAIAGNQITISGGNVTATATGRYSHAICSYSTLDICGGATVTAKATSTGSYPAVYGAGVISVSDSRVTAVQREMRLFTPPPTSL